MQLQMTQANERAGEAIESEQGEHVPEERFYDAVGRPRKLAAGAMTAIMREFEKGVPTKELAERYGVSPTLILVICYHTPKGRGTRPAMPDKKPVTGWSESKP